MKTIKIFWVMLLVCLASQQVSANKWNKPDKGYFTYQKDVDNTVSDESKSMSTIYYHSKLFNFINYGTSNSAKIVIRQLTLSSDRKNWSYIKQDNISNLSGLECGEFGDWQPCPVVFHDTLFLFVPSGSALVSNYDEIHDSWSVPRNPLPKYVDNFICMADLQYASAMVVDDKLCLLTRDKSFLTVQMYWTKDMKTWHRYDTGIAPRLYDTDTFTDGLPPFQTKVTYNFYEHISAISKSWIDNSGKLNSKIMVAYIAADESVKVNEFYFNDMDAIIRLSDVTVANEDTYSSVSIADGKVKKDPATGNCSQLFLKKATKDNGYCRYRILRYQKVEGASWTKQENNLVPQNYLWADKNLELNAVNFAYTETVSGVQVTKYLLCLVYRGYDDWDHPLNCAWAENDQAVPYNAQSKLQDVESVPAAGIHAGGNGIGKDLIMDYRLSRVRNRPNPFSSVTTICYIVGDEEQESIYGPVPFTTISIFDRSGNPVAILVHERKSPGTYEVEWDASSLPPGIYLCRIETGNRHDLCKLVIGR